MKKYLIDTNILIYAIDSGSEYYQKSKQFIENLKGLVDLFITSKNIDEFLAVSTNPRNKNFSISPKKALNHLEEYKAYTKTIYPSDESEELYLRLIEKLQPVSDS